MTPDPLLSADREREDAARRGTFVRILREYASRAHDNYSGRVVVPEVILGDAAACIEDQRAELDRLAALSSQPAPDAAAVDALAGEVAVEIGDAYSLSRDHRQSRWHEEHPDELHRESWACVPLTDATYAVMAAAHRAALRAQPSALSSPETTPAPDVGDGGLRRELDETKRQRDRAWQNLDTAHEDIAAMLRASGLGDHARPISTHDVIRGELLPWIEAHALPQPGEPT